LDTTYQKQLQQGGDMIKFPEAASETPEEFNRQIVDSAAEPLFVIPKPKDTGLPDPQFVKDQT
jgi:hypothetical protein